MVFKTLTDIIRGEIKNATIHKTRKTTGNIKEGWFTTDIKHKITERDRVYVKKCRFPEIQQYEEDFKNLNEQLKNIIKRNKKAHIDAKFSLAGLNEKKKWNAIRDVTFLDNKNEQANTILVDDVELVDSGEVANAMNNHFIDIVKKIIPPQTVDKKQSTNTCGTENKMSMFLKPTNTAEIKKIIDTLKTNAAPG
ncbi:hypothetical protein HHI36_011071, partial [Cryptolaemus montrouzieri]